MPPRDVLLTVGSEILEATMSYRCRWFEYLNYRPLMQQYFNEDPKFRHEAAPKPRLTDADYHPDYLSDKIGVEKRLKWAAEKVLCDHRGRATCLMRRMCCVLGVIWWFSMDSLRI